jgi:hypothetical protein
MARVAATIGAAEPERIVLSWKHGFIDSLPEENMLSPHEFAALLLIGGTREAADLDPDDLASLVERQLVALDQLVAGRRLQLTEYGASVVRAVSRRPN